MQFIYGILPFPRQTCDLGISGDFLDWSLLISSGCLRGNHVQGESKDANLDLFLTPESIALF